MISRLIVATAVALFLIPGLTVRAQEHPEHPKKTTEHPKQGAEHPKKGTEKQVSTADISAGIKKNIEAETKKSSDGKYFACVDMKAADGKIYDIDFFLTGPPGGMKVTDTTVHKIDGKPLYDWKEKDGKWQKVPAS